MAPEQLLGELEGDDGVIVCDLEAGVGTVLRILPGQADLVLLVVDPSAKAIEVARRAARIAAGRGDVLVIANRVRDDADLDTVRSALGEHQVVAVPEDPAIMRAERDGRAPIDAANGSSGVEALLQLAERLGRRMADGPAR